MDETLLEINVRFGGFYNTIHDMLLETLVEGMGEIDDWKSLQGLYVKEYVAFLNKLMNTNMKYIEVLSPKEYNSETDVGVAKISEQDAQTIIRYAKECCQDEVDQAISFATIRREGFIPFFNKKTILLDENRDHLITLILEAIINQDNFNDEVISHFEGVCF